MELTFVLLDITSRRPVPEPDLPADRPRMELQLPLHFRIYVNYACLTDIAVSGRRNYRSWPNRSTCVGAQSTDGQRCVLSARHCSNVRTLFPRGNITRDIVSFIRIAIPPIGVGKYRHLAANVGAKAA
ncbi:hypothetical protein [Paenibacillus sp. BT-177]|uniref:hypothetical protein n=1 Tax=Paenibacillus sp. BT-177 TaxID=2986930 RepID=UPI0021F70DAC|nr:hypothetical protein [Paenibacillus sp. BT-177]